MLSSNTLKFSNNLNFVPSTIRVLLVDDHDMLVKALASLLNDEPDIEVIGVVTSISAAIATSVEIRPDLVLMDYRLDDGNGLDAVRTLRGLMPEIKVVMLTASPNDALVTEALEAGCSGFVAKGSSIPDLLSTVRTAASGGAAFGPNVVARMMRSRSQAIDGPRLSPRELEVIMMIAAGDSTGGIAHSLGLSQHTVRNHTRNLLTKLGAHSKLEAVVIATRTGLIRLPLES